MILKNKEGNVRLVWRFFLLVAPFFLTAFLLCYIPIRIQASILIRQGLPESQAVLQARNLFLVDPIGVSILGIIQGLLWYGLVYLLVRYLEKKPFSMGSFGLLFNGSSLVLMIGVSYWD